MSARDAVRDEFSWTPFAAQAAEYERLLDAYRREVLAEAIADLQVEIDGVWPYTRPHAAAVECGIELARDLLQQLADGRPGRTP